MTITHDNDERKMKIGIAVTTTPNREETFQRWYHAYKKHVPNIPLCIHNDTQYQGVVYSKNKCINHLYKCGFENMFYFDDDCIIQSEHFVYAYINSGLEHACWNLDREFIGYGCVSNYGKCDYYSEYKTPNGCMLYATRKVIDVVGGFDTDFTGYGYEHPNWSDRIFNNGLTPARYVDIPHSNDFFKMANCQSSFSNKDRERIPANYSLYQQKYYSKEFKPFR